MTEEQEIIAKRTRSKVCLQATPIETIEATFVPPDITTDMYDFDCDIDNVWKEFLQDFTMPLNHDNENDDEETDPEFVAPKVHFVDREELLDTKVPKKEVQNLMKDFLDMLEPLQLYDEDDEEEVIKFIEV